MEPAQGITGKSCGERERKPKRFLPFGAGKLGQDCPPRRPQEKPQAAAEEPGSVAEALGEPIGIREVAQFIGCSVWTVRQRCLWQGLPHFRTSRSGRLIFYRNQVIRWLIDKQTERR